MAKKILTTCCPLCKGTGLIIPKTSLSDIAYQCPKCHGKASRNISVKLFEGRKKKQGINYVDESNSETLYNRWITKNPSKLPKSLGKYEVVIECDKCSGTGLYSDCRKFRSGHAGVCSRCQGKGFVVSKFVPFTKRRAVANVKRVLPEINSNYYVCLSDQVIDTNPITAVDTGISYDDWAKKVAVKIDESF